MDAHGNLLATNRPIYNVYWKGNGTYKLCQNQQNKLKKLEAILGTPFTNNTSLLGRIERAQRHYKRELICSDISFEQLSKLEEQFPNEPNIEIETKFRRFYPHETCASHILGYLGRINPEAIGKMGLERLFEGTLRGQHGTTIATINSFGRKLAETPLAQALAGSDIRTTLDLHLQTIVEEIFPKNQTGTCIIMNPDSGAILATTSRPHFDPTLFLDPISHQTWKKMQDNQPFLNRAFNATYPPGSIFKLQVACAALEHGVITPETMWDCKGYITFGGRRYHCHKLHGHGRLNVSQALEQSCNPFFYDIGTKMSIDTLADYAHRFGLGKKTGIIFPEREGLVPSTKWKEETKGEQWWPGETLSAAVGQSFLLVTPLQVARMIASIFTGKLVTPRILMGEPIITTPLEIKQETLDFLQQSMKKVVTQGTGKRVSRMTGMEIYAKTSTAQTSALHKRNRGRRFREHGWFVAQFRYNEYQPLTMVVLVEHAGGSRIPTTIAKQFLVRYKRLMDRQMSQKNMVY